MNSLFYVRHCFRVSDDVVGAMQHAMIDREQTVAAVAAAFHVSKATAYRVRAAVPAELVRCTWTSTLPEWRRSRRRKGAA